MTSNNTANEIIKELQPQLSSLQANASAVLSKAYSQTISTYSIAQALQYMERAMNALITNITEFIGIWAKYTLILLAK